MSAIERAEQDIANGDLGLARQRLVSYLVSQGYRDDVLRRIGRVCYEMKDLYQAGRYWLLSSEDSPQAREVIDLFLQRAGPTTQHVIGELHQVIRAAAKEDFPEIVHRRLEEYALTEILDARAKRRSLSNKRPPWSQQILTSGCLIVFVAAVICFIAGVDRILRWLF